MATTCSVCQRPVEPSARICPYCGTALSPGGGTLVDVVPRPAHPNARVAPPAPPTIPLIVGILGFFFPVLGPVAWILGSQYEKQCRAANVIPDSSGTLAKWLGIITTLLLAGLVFFLISLWNLV